MKKILHAGLREQLSLARKIKPLTTTLELATLIASAVPFHEPNKHPATRSFQAIRIFINQELTALQAGLAQCVPVLKAGGRLVVISFHSLEDRIVKQFMQEQARGDAPDKLPLRETSDCTAFCRQSFNSTDGGRNRE